MVASPNEVQPAGSLSSFVGSSPGHKQTETSLSNRWRQTLHRNRPGRRASSLQARPTSDGSFGSVKADRSVCSGSSRRFGFVRFRRHCGREFLRQGRDGPYPEITLKLFLKFSLGQYRLYGSIFQPQGGIRLAHGSVSGLNRSCQKTAFHRSRRYNQSAAFSPSVGVWTPKSAFRREISHRERACEHDIIIGKK